MHTYSYTVNQPHSCSCCSLVRKAEIRKSVRSKRTTLGQERCWVSEALKNWTTSRAADLKSCLSKTPGWLAWRAPPRFSQKTGKYTFRCKTHLQMYSPFQLIFFSVLFQTIRVFPSWKERMLGLVRSLPQFSGARLCQSLVSEQTGEASASLLPPLYSV